jgi:ABC-type ATPase involved in cell division
LVTTLHLESNLILLNTCQKPFFKKIKGDLMEKQEQVHYLDGPGGMGKNSLLNTILDYTAVDGITTVVTASSGVAALLLKNRQTVHLAFKILIDVLKGTKCSLNKDSAISKILALVNLVFWDEIVTIHKNTIEAVNKSLCSIMQLKQTIWGKSCNSSRGFPSSFTCGEVQRVSPVICSFP